MHVYLQQEPLERQQSYKETTNERTWLSFAVLLKDPFSLKRVARNKKTIYPVNKYSETSKPICLTTTQYDQVLNMPFSAGKIIEVAKFGIIKNKI